MRVMIGQSQNTRCTQLRQREEAISHGKGLIWLARSEGDIFAGPRNACFFLQSDNCQHYHTQETKKATGKIRSRLKLTQPLLTRYRGGGSE